MADYTFRNVLDARQTIRDNELVLSTALRIMVRCPKAEVAWVCIRGVIRAKPGTGAKFEVVPTYLRDKRTAVWIMRVDGKEFTYGGVEEPPLEIAAQLDARGYTIRPWAAQTRWPWRLL